MLERIRTCHALIHAIDITNYSFTNVISKFDHFSSKKKKLDYF